MEGLHCTASGVAELGPNPGRLQLFHYDSVLRELVEEVGIEERDLTSLRLIAFCREMMRVGKPQMFFVGTTELSEGELNHRMRGARATARNDGKYVENIGPVLLRELGEAWRPREIASMTPELAATLHYIGKLQGMHAAGSGRGRGIRSLFRAWRQ
jgi:hypothetical protein